MVAEPGWRRILIIPSTTGGVPAIAAIRWTVHFEHAHLNFIGVPRRYLQRHRIITGIGADIRRQCFCRQVTPLLSERYNPELSRAYTTLALLAAASTIRLTPVSETVGAGIQLRPGACIAADGAINTVFFHHGVERIVCSPNNIIINTEIYAGASRTVSQLLPPLVERYTADPDKASTLGPTAYMTGGRMTTSSVT